MQMLPRGRKVGPAIFDRRHLRLTQGMVGYWSPVLTGATGLQLLDLSGENNHVTLTNMDAPTDWVDAQVGKVVDFDGVNDYATATIQTLNLQTQSVSFSFWNQNSSGTTGVYASLASSTSGTPFLIFQASGTSITLTHRNNASGDSAAVGGTWQSATWRLLTGVSTPSSLTLFANGVQVATTTRTAGATNLNRLTLGALDRAGTLNNYAVSRNAETILHLRALTPSEIQTVHALGPGGLGRRLRDDFFLYETAIAYSLEASTASYSLTGQPIPLLYGRVLPADTGNVLLSGQTTPLLTSRLLNADQGSYAYSGTDAATLLGRLLDAGAAAYTLDGNAAGFLASRRISADTVAYLASGLDAGFLRSRVLEAGTGQYVLVASPVNLQTGTPGTGGAAPYYYLFLLGGSR